ncbi:MULTISPECIES: aminopeptidase P family protein [Methylorubrum]|jgi:Xaa-Pro aminopeptidase|uniref:Aminopeptidase n=2 Tax=Methylorubrum extorquens TaxID=408 RepID=C5ASS0_METEA|nr:MULTISPECIES: aminopeptidase P family protein [Methylorubrum]ACS42533.1 aminopeptidase [Methylorubrum extorquens AM1]EHP91555.1 peptidase M24 [Methylorubrum extorquens DSM 13060]MCP1544397.1 Xaa-Pro aminopeptidase [Methylorubrum extorquens]MCP1588258.1 Xaa-Pro aminopeptidase [Methylorubrum extorquens]BDL42008.1 aminopeptidase [Methylorubrum sp. GM97]
MTTPLPRFQTFDDPSHAKGPERIEALRAALREIRADGFVVPRADEHQSEYVPANAERLAWLTGFTGSAGLAVVLADEAALFVDGRYTLQAPEQVDTGIITVVPLVETTPEAWLGAHLKPGQTLAYDPWLHTPDGVARLERAAIKAGASLRAVPDNLVDAVWAGRPRPPAGRVAAHPDDLAGETRSDKLDRIRAALAEGGIDTLVISDPHNLAWTFNLRGSDIAHTPLALGYALVPREGRAALYLTSPQIDADLRAALEPLADLRPRSAFDADLAGLCTGAARVRIDAATAAAALKDRIEAADGVADVGADPVTAMKAVKNPAEIAGTRAAHHRDGLAVTRFLAWLDRAAPEGVSEIAAVEALEDFRKEGGLLRDVSFPTISGSGPNGAIVHYRVTRATDRTAQPGELFLIDSGAQYADGTTDITRTVAIGTPTDAMRDRFTRVLKGHIAIARAVFPEGTTGAQIDAFARMSLWEAGLDYDHGTGHGVGAFLSVHEGPQRIAKTGTVALKPGMILSNEPGYYRSHAYGIRIENLILVEARTIPGGDRTMLGFETLTLAPIDRRLIDPAVLGARDAAWLDAYHARVREALSPDLDGPTRDWLEAATRPLGAV